MLLHHKVLDSLHDELGASIHHSGKQPARGGEPKRGSKEWGVEMRTKKKKGTGGGGRGEGGGQG